MPVVTVYHAVQGGSICKLGVVYYAAQQRLLIDCVFVLRGEMSPLILSASPSGVQNNLTTQYHLASLRLKVLKFSAKRKR